MLFSASISNLYGQINNGRVGPDTTSSVENSKKEKEIKAPKPESNDSLTGTNFYITGLYQYTYRVFEDQSATHHYREWESQTSSYNGGASAGVVMEMSKYLHLDIGLSYFGNSEEYTYSDSLTDSTYSYRNTYMQLAIPLRVRFVYGDKLQFFAFAGIAPLNILRLRYESDYTKADGTHVVRDPEKFSDTFAQFNLMVTAGIGIQYNFRYVGFTLYPEYRRHLLNTYSNKTVSMSHKMYGIGLNFGMVLRF